MLRLLTRLAVAGAVLALICWAGAHYLLADWPQQPFVPKLAYLLLTIAVAGAAFLGCAALLGVSEVREIFGAIERRLRRSPRA
jgi:hypothetical protein